MGQYDLFIDYASQLADFALSLGFIVGPLIGYVAQYQLIKTSKSVGSFSIDVCAILLFANILRIFFWYEKRFENALLFQSILMIMMQIELLRLCLQTKSKAQSIYKTTTFFENPINKFWRWTELKSFIASLLSFTIMIFSISFYFQSSIEYWEILGFMSCLVESTLGLPQALKNHTTGSVKGLSYAMIGSWFFGDAFKTFYFVIKHQPMQFIMCGVIQLTVDIWIMLQIAIFSSKKQDLEL